MKVIIGRIIITDEHPASSYGAGVAVVGESVFGPDDVIPSTLPAGPKFFRCAELIKAGAYSGCYTPGEIAFLNKFLSQSPDPITLNYSEMQEKMARRRQIAKDAESV